MRVWQDSIVTVKKRSATKESVRGGNARRLTEFIGDLNRRSRRTPIGSQQHYSAGKGQRGLEDHASQRSRDGHEPIRRSF